MKTILDFILVRENIEWMLIALIPGLLVLGAGIGALVGRARGSLPLDTARGACLGLSGLGLWVMWQVYNGMIGIYGLDTVKMLLMNLALFVTVGVAIGLGAPWVDRLLVAKLGDEAPVATPDGEALE